MSKIFIMLIAGLLVLNFVSAQELLENGDFSDSTGVWQLEEYGGGDLTWNIVDSIGRVIIDVDGENFWDLQVKQQVPIETGWDYDISFDIAASASSPIKVWIQTAHDSYDILHEKAVTATEEWQTVSYTTDEMEVDDDNCKITFVLGDVAVGDTVFLDNVSMSYGGTLDIEENADIHPMNFSLSQNYPNPFNPITTISYSIKKQSMVTIEIFNTLGEKVQTLVNEEKSAGNYQILWNASTLSSGIYFYRLIADNNVLTRKMLLTK